MKGGDKDYKVLREELEHLFKRIENNKLSEKEYKEVKSEIFDRLGFMSTLIYEHKEQPFFTSLFRVRKADKISEGEDLSDIKTYYYPAPKNCDLARANLKGCPVFYLADNESTAIKEAEGKDGEITFISEWKLETDEPFTICMLFADKMDNKHYWKDIIKRFNEKLEKELNKYAEKDQAAIRKLHYLCSNMFASEDYAVSSLIGHYLLYEQDKLADTLLYPSIADKKEYCNMAVSTSFSDKALKLISLKKVKISKKGNEFKTEILKEAEIKNNRISW